jgi:hypothetical protein
MRHRRHTAANLVIRFGLVLLLSVITAFASYAIVTARNVPEREDYVAEGTTSLTGEYLVTLPCGAPNYDSSKPILPEARGIPFNFNYYTPCEPNVMLRDGYVLDVGFWFLVYASAYVGFLMYRRANSKIKK